ncbi:PhzF family phenazine biosynthesis protein [Gilvimarinus polysaccharolyticus]|uniref:PhzF family phenazine biosynthesis protein n=1 Tax=Gilvimarinus polysaccharolyticus TaxID=863921 RepID=UPI0006732FDF|nr:PhzF family phenazine biosynthesis protein [Gilvimarinus polysaccharolyticus]
MRLAIDVVNAFSRGPFTGNPAAVIVTETALDDTLMQAVAAQNNLAETVFVVTQAAPWAIRWFTPMREVDLCGHATLAAAYVLSIRGLLVGGRVEFSSRSGLLVVTQQKDGWQLDFPARTVGPVLDVEYDHIAQALGCELSAIVACYDGVQLMVVMTDEAAVASLNPDHRALARLHDFAVMVTAAAQNDFVARFFAPNAGIDEDPVTGSAYTTLMPYWAEHLQLSHCRARQLSVRGGWLECTLVDTRVLITGVVEPYLQGEIQLPAY